MGFKHCNTGVKYLIFKTYFILRLKLPFFFVHLPFFFFFANIQLTF